MKSSDKVLIGIVVGIVLLVVVAFAAMLLQPKPEYQSEDTPEGVAHNYLLALDQEDYERAYGYLSPTLRYYPDDVEEFTHDVNDNSWRFRLDYDKTITVESATITGSLALVEVRESRFYGGDLFDSGQSVSTFEMELRLINDDWKIHDSYYYFTSCWTDYSKWCD